MLCVNPVPFGNILNSSEVNYSPYRNSFKPDDFANNPSGIKNGHQHNYVKVMIYDDIYDEGNDLKKKEMLYLFALNRNCPRKSKKKIKKLPTVSNLPTIFESYTYPLTIEEFLSGAE